MPGGPLRASTVLARRAADIVVIDTGLPQHTASLVAGLEAAGVVPDDVTAVLNTHAHIDHSHNNSLFRHARIYASVRDREWTRTLHEALERSADPCSEDVMQFYPELPPETVSSKMLRKVLGIEKMLWDEARWGQPEQFAWLEDEAPPEGIIILPTPGHTPHHVSFIIHTATRPVLVAGDALLVRDEEQFTLQLVPPQNLAAYLHSRQQITRFDGIIVPGHDVPFDNQPR